LYHQPLHEEERIFPDDPLLRVLDQSKLEFFRKFINEFSLKGLRKINILVFGGAGSGKSTFQNSLRLALMGEDNQVATVGVKGATTKVLARLPLNPFGDCPIYCWDLPGFAERQLYSEEEFKQILRGERRDGYRPDLSPQATVDSTMNNRTVEDRVHCMLMLVKAHHRDDNSYTQWTAHYIRVAENLGIPVVVGVSFVDKLDSTEMFAKDPGLILRSSVVKEEMILFAKELERVQEHIVPFVNEQAGCHNTDSRDILILFVFYKVLLAVRSLYYRHDWKADIDSASFGSGSGSGSSSSGRAFSG